MVVAWAPGQPPSFGDGLNIGWGVPCEASGGGNEIGGDLIVQDNTSVRGPVPRIAVGNNRVGGVISCFDNVPAPDGGNNEAAGKLGQCEGL